MKFDNVNIDTNCNCIEGCNQDSSSYFGLKTNKNVLRDNDFKSKWEMAGGLDITDCEEVCSNKGKSISLVNDNVTDFKNEVINIFKGLFPLSPSYRPFISIVKFKEEAGLIKNTPLSNNPYHRDFYKCDSFNLELVDLIEVIPLAENV